MAAEEALREAVSDLKQLSHLAMHYLRLRVEAGTATDSEAMALKMYDSAFDRMQCERQAIFDDLQLS